MPLSIYIGLWHSSHLHSWCKITAHLSTADIRDTRGYLQILMIGYSPQSVRYGYQTTVGTTGTGWLGGTCSRESKARRRDIIVCPKSWLLYSQFRLWLQPFQCRQRPGQDCNYTASTVTAITTITATSTMCCAGAQLLNELHELWLVGFLIRKLAARTTTASFTASGSSWLIYIFS